MTPEMFPIRVLVETVNSQHCLSCSHDGYTLLDTFAIVSGQTPIGQLVDTVLSALGHPELIADSRGLIQLNNWKPLAFEAITDNQEELVANLFKEISNRLTLKILTKGSSNVDSQSSQCINEVKQKLLKLAVEKHPSLISSVDNHEVKELVRQLVASGEDGLANLSASSISTINEWLDQVATAENGSRRRSTQLASARFNPLTEVPRLEKWFRSDPNPSKQKLTSYMHILNGGHHRKAVNSKVTYQQLCNWFAMQRAAQRPSASTADRQSQAHLNGHSHNTVGNGGKAAVGLLLDSPFGDSMGGGALNFAKLMGLNTQASTGLQTGPNAMTQQQQQFASALLKNPFLFGAMAGFDTQFMSQLQPFTTGSGELLGTMDVASQRMEHDQHLIRRENGSASSTHIPVSSLPTDIAAKFNGFSSSNGEMAAGGGGSNGGKMDGTTTSITTHGGSERIDGGSESPTGNEDISVHSAGASDMEGGDGEGKDSGTSTPDVCLDVINPDNPSEQTNLHQSSVGTASSALLGGGRPPLSPNSTAMAAFSSLLPSMSFFNSTLSMGQRNNSSPSPDSDSDKLRDECLSVFSARTPTKLEMNNGEVPQSTTPSSSHAGNNNMSNSARSRLMFDPLSELPILERWFEDNPHPGWLQIEQYTETLNSYPYRQNYPPISTHNVKIWFKNRRAKCKRLNLTDVPGKMLMSS